MEARAGRKGHGVKDIADGNMVTLQVFREGQSPEDSAAIAKFPLTVKGGSVSAKWLYRADQSVMPPEENLRFIFSFSRPIARGVTLRRAATRLKWSL